MAILPLDTSFGLAGDIAQLRAQMESLQRQLATGKKAETYGNLGSGRLLSLSLRARVSAVEGFQKTIGQAQLRLEAMQNNLGRFNELAKEMRTEALDGPFDPGSGMQTQAQANAALRLDEAIALLNLDVAGRHLFAGRDTEQNPVLTPDEILNGAGGRAGLKQLIFERRLADLGADGRGRLQVGPAAGTTVSLAEDAASSPFGFKLAGVSSTLSGTTVTPPSGSPASLDVTFSGTLPQPGETLRITMSLPDGTQEVLELTATATAPAGDGEFLIGADANATAANFEAALAAGIEDLGATALRSASSMAAAEDFFVFDDANPPRRVDGPPFETATALVDATDADTILWYRGDAGPGPARESAIARVDDSLKVDYGARASEAPLRTTVMTLAVLAAETFDPADPEAEARYEALSERASERLSFPDGARSVLDLIGELGFKQRALNDAQERHEGSLLFTQGLLDETENADPAEIGTKLLNLQVRLQASFQTTASIARLSLVNFL